MKSFRRTNNATHLDGSTVLRDLELDVVNGGDSMLTLLTRILQMSHEMQKGIIQNLRA